VLGLLKVKMRLTEGDQPCADDEVSDVATCEKRFCVCAEGSSMFWKRLNARSATELLSTEPAGTYLLRRSEHPKFEYTLSQVSSTCPRVFFHLFVDVLFENECHSVCVIWFGEHNNPTTQEISAITFFSFSWFCDWHLEPRTLRTLGFFVRA